MSGQEFFHVFTVREKLGLEIPERIPVMVNKSLADYRRAQLQDLALNLAGSNTNILDKLTQMKQAIELAERNIPSRSRLCAQGVLNLTEENLRDAFAYISEDQPSGARFNFDLAFGMGAPAAFIRFDEDLKAHVNPNQQYPRILGEAQLCALYIGLRDAGTAALTETSTDFDIFRTWIERITTRPEETILPVSERAYVLGGAQLSGELFPGFYQITAPLYPDVGNPGV